MWLTGDILDNWRNWTCKPSPTLNHQLCMPPSVHGCENPRRKEGGCPLQTFPGKMQQLNVYDDDGHKNPGSIWALAKLEYLVILGRFQLRIHASPKSEYPGDENAFYPSVQLMDQGIIQDTISCLWLNISQPLLTCRSPRLLPILRLLAEPTAVESPRHRRCQCLKYRARLSWTTVLWNPVSLNSLLVNSFSWVPNKSSAQS